MQHSLPNLLNGGALVMYSLDSNIRFPAVDVFQLRQLPASEAQYSFSAFPGRSRGPRTAEPAVLTQKDAAT